jgi:hypothetical protein
MDVTALRNLAYRDIGEDLIGNARVTPEMLLTAFNEGYEVVASAARCFVREETLLTVANQVVYTLPADMFAVRAVRNQGCIQPLVLTTPQGMAIYDRTYRSTASLTPTHAYFFDARSIGVYPAPDASDRQILVEGFIIPRDWGDETPPTGAVLALEDETDEPAFPANYHSLLAHFVVYTFGTRFRRVVDDSEARAQAAKADYDALMAEFTAFVSTGINLGGVARA